jgi:hypothetical protein
MRSAGSELAEVPMFDSVWDAVVLLQGKECALPEDHRLAVDGRVDATHMGDLGRCDSGGTSCLTPR